MTFEELVQNGGWPPSRNGMLDLGDRSDTLLLQYIVSSAHEQLTPELHWLTANLARLADKAVREYRAASECLTASVATRLGVPDDEAPSVEGHTQLLRATDHLENCVDAVRRVEGFFSTQAFKDVTTSSQRRLLETVHKGVRDLRNAIQHAGERLADGLVSEGEPVFPAAASDGLYFAGKLVLYAELAGLVIAVWELAAAGIEATTTAPATTV